MYSGFLNNNLYPLLKDIENFYNASTTEEGLFNQQILLYAPKSTGKSYTIEKFSDAFNIKYIGLDFYDSTNVRKIISTKSDIIDDYSIIHLKFCSLEFNDSVNLEKILFDINSWFTRLQNRVMLIISTNEFNSKLFEMCNEYLVYKFGCLSIDEKVNIIKDYLNNKPFYLADTLIKDIIKRYTQESGVAQLLNCIKRIHAYCVINKIKEITDEVVRKILGVPRYIFHEIDTCYQMGVGLGWTKYGGKVLLLEVLIKQGCGKLEIVGNIKKTMHDSIILVYRVLIDNAERLSLNKEIIENSDLTISIPELAENKDGASMGSAIFLKLFCLFSKKKLNQKIALSGEITLSGNIIRVGGLKEKLSAAEIANIRTIILPKQSEYEVNLIGNTLLDKFNIFYVNDIYELIDILKNYHYFC